MTITTITPEDLLKMANEFHAVLSIKMEGDDPDAYVMRGNELVSIMATSGKMLADAKYHRDKAISENVINSLKQALNEKLPASTINEFIKAECKDLNYLVNFIEQVNKECKYQVELLRSLISLRKTEMNNLGMNQ